MPRARSIRNVPELLFGLTALGLIACRPASSGQKPAPRYENESEVSGTPAPAQPGVNVPAIKVNTVGYPSGWRLRVISNVEPRGARLETEAGQLVTASIEVTRHSDSDPASLDPVWQLQLPTDLNPGRYLIRIEPHRSDVFEITARPYRDALLLSQKHFYFQRTRTALVAPYARFGDDEYLRLGVSHAHDDVGWDLEDYPEKKRRWQLERGWHDAGNYDMYVPSTAPTVQALLLAYEHAPHLFADGDLNIPESDNGVADLLDEARWGLDWILSMQERDTGAFRHREAVMEWSPSLPADRDRSTRWVAGPSTAATGKAVAALAVARRVYAAIDPAYAERIEESLKKGLTFLLEHPEPIRADGKGSPQPLWDDEPQYNDFHARFLADTEVWRSLRDPKALERVRAGLSKPETEGAQFLTGAWTNLSRWALSTLARDPQTPEDLRREARARILKALAPLRERVEQLDGYRVATGTSEYYWGHNSNLAEKAQLLLVGAELDGGDWMREAARDQWHWLLGRNPNGYSMITRVGKGPDRIYHMEWGHRSPPPPGFLIGGPNATNLGFLSPNAPAKALLWDNPTPLRSGLPASSLWHCQQSDLWDGGFLPEDEWREGWWAVTEPDIYYNANLVLFAAHLLSDEAQRGGVQE